MKLSNNLALWMEIMQMVIITQPKEVMDLASTGIWKQMRPVLAFS